MKRIHELAVEKGIRDKITLLAGGTQVIAEQAIKNGMDAGFGRGTKGIHVATALVECRRKRQ
jgi:D-ornithine 4,5-aminomutase subunit beta